MAVNAYIYKEERSQINNPHFHLEKLEKADQRDGRKLINIRAEISQVENRKTIRGLEKDQKSVTGVSPKELKGTSQARLTWMGAVL